MTRRAVCRIGGAYVGPGLQARPLRDDLKVVPDE